MQKKQIFRAIEGESSRARVNREWSNRARIQQFRSARDLLARIRAEPVPVTRATKKEKERDIRSRIGLVKRN